jgi:adenylate kinase family enzyme
MRISVVGTSGSGKTTLARELGRSLGLPFIEIDALNWQAGWRDLYTHDPEEFQRRLEEVTRREHWVIDGNYGRVAEAALIQARATHFVWLDYDRPLVMRRVILRSFARAVSGRELWEGTGNIERFGDWLKPDHPIRWAWRTWARRRAQYEAFVSQAPAHLTVIRLRHPREAKSVAMQISSAASP